jgi:hypothetical protein
MIARGFKSVIWVGAVGSAALGCYMVSLRVATERAQLASVERQIMMAQRDIRTLKTELGTRGRLSQLEEWNAEVLALSAPTTAQFLQNEVTLARFEQKAPSVGEAAASVHMASAEAPAAAQPSTQSPTPPMVRAVAPAPQQVQPSLVHRASYTPAPARQAAAPTVQVKIKTEVAAAPVKPKPATVTASAATAAKPKPKPALAVTASAPKPKPPVATASAAPAKPKAKAGTGRLDKLAAELGAKPARAEKRASQDASGGN